MLPSNIWRLKNLQTLSIEGNTQLINFMPAEVYHSGNTKMVLKHLKQQQKQVLEKMRGEREKHQDVVIQEQPPENGDGNSSAQRSVPGVSDNRRKSEPPAPLKGIFSFSLLFSFSSPLLLSSLFSSFFSLLFSPLSSLLSPPSSLRSLVSSYSFSSEGGGELAGTQN